ncbi:MAG: transcriptional regulator, partial [Vicinamibacterales bacterium]
MSNLYEFGPFRLDLQEQRLLSEGKPVPLTSKSFQLLRVLVENPDRLLPKDELLKLVWPDSYVEEGNLSHHVFALRKALGDEKLSAQYIETVPRRGYRFSADVKELNETVAREAPVVREHFAAQSRAIERGSVPVTDVAPHISGVSVHDRRWRLGATASAVAILLAMTVIGVVAYRWRVGNV